MEDDEDCYGFGALSDMFDDRSATASISLSSPRSGGVSGAIAGSVRPVQAKKLDVEAMSRFWWSERKLQEFRRGAQREAKEYHHLAAKFDGMRVDGGLGSLFLVPKGRADDGLRDGGVLWIQAQASDSNAQARRKKEFQDITNRLPLATVDVNVRRPDPLKTPKGSLKSTATVFLSMDEILEATETTVQHTVQGVKFSLRSGHQFEIAFMPGPFYDARNRDELLHAFQRQQIDDVFSPTPSPTAVRPATAQTTVLRTSPPQLQLPAASVVLADRSARSASPNQSSSQPTSRVQTPLGSPGELRSAPGSASSAGAAQDSQPPVDHRALIRRYVQLDEKSTEAIVLAKKIHASRQYHVGPLESEFPSFSSDVVYRKKTVEELSRTLERMNQDWKMSEQERLLHTRASVGRDENDMFQYTDTITFETISSKTYQERYTEYVDSEQPEAPPVLRLFEPRVRIPSARLEEKRSIPVAEARATRSEVPKAALFGLDIRRSSIITDSLLQTWRSMPCPTDDDLAGWTGLLDERAVADARESFTRGVLDVMQHIQQQGTSPVETSTSSSSSASSSPSQVGSQRRRSSSRRRSLDQPSLEDLHAEFVGTGSIDQVSRASPSKRPRTSTSSDGSPSTTRRRRRQSLVGTLDESLTEEKDGEGFLQPMDTVCPLCCDADAVVVMKPCGHSVCRTCWGRLARAESSSGDESVETRQCPWDRETVTER